MGVRVELAVRPPQPKQEMKISKPNHTPGPWHTAGDQGVQIRSQREQLAKVWTMRGNEWKANARLIAAAPELLESLIELADCGAEAWGEDRPCVRIARDAIAKAA